MPDLLLKLEKGHARCQCTQGRNRTLQKLVWAWVDTCCAVANVAGGFYDVLSDADWCFVEVDLLLLGAGEFGELAQVREYRMDLRIA